VNAYFARHALLPEGWKSDVRFEIGTSGEFAAITPDSTDMGTTPFDIVLPGMPNAHSHAFQRVLAGRAERARPGGDSFWSWREAMYRALEDLTPDEFEAVTTDAYRTMLAAGYTSVCEFHYVHNAPGGVPYAQPGELAERVISAARHAGIGLTLLLVLYRFSDFGETPPRSGQARFTLGLDSFAALWQQLTSTYGHDPAIRIGIAPHSLRAIALDDLSQLAALAASVAETPLHVHVSEQIREIEACRARYGVTPIDLLGSKVQLDRHWCLVHATHATDQELSAVVASRAVVALCPTTEANLGDGIFPAAPFVSAGGRFAIGSDSNVTIDVPEELRWLEYGQRLSVRERNLLRDDAQPSVGRYLYESALAGGAQASGRQIGALRPGYRADFLAFDAAFAFDERTALDMLVFRSGTWKVADVIVGGKRIRPSGE